LHGVYLADRSDGEIFLPIAPFTHIYGFLQGPLVPLSARGETVIPERFQPEHVELLTRHLVSFFCGGPPAIYAGVLRTGAVVDAAEISAHCASQLVNHKCPSEVRVIEQLPVTAAHKLDRVALRRAAHREEGWRPAESAEPARMLYQAGNSKELRVMSHVPLTVNGRPAAAGNKIGRDRSVADCIGFDWSADFKFCQSRAYAGAAESLPQKVIALALVA
jgi:hypothetical protein